MEMIMIHKDALELFNIKPEYIHDLLLTIFKTNIFKFNKKLYKQLRGLAMGNRLAPLLAIIFVHKIETTIIQALRPINFLRFIDDTFVITKTLEELEILFTELNNAHPQIEFTKEEPTENGLPFLNCNIKKFENGDFTTTWYRKAT
uniref:Reverse transcriptase domain-containing protein n=1 Tax=Panagrolaimus sp. ES5 TaxID=591445 RepID=A0AC34GEH4_9BILA